MKITDLNGCPIEVNDLDKAIQKASQYKEYKHKDLRFSEFDKQQRVYWADMWGKPTAIKIHLSMDFEAD